MEETKIINIEPMEEEIKVIEQQNQEEFQLYETPVVYPDTPPEQERKKAKVQKKKNKKDDSDSDATEEEVKPKKKTKKPVKKRRREDSDEEENPRQKKKKTSDDEGIIDTGMPPPPTRKYQSKPYLPTKLCDECKELIVMRAAITGWKPDRSTKTWSPIIKGSTVWYNCSFSNGRPCTVKHGSVSDGNPSNCYDPDQEYWDLQEEKKSKEDEMLKYLMS